VANQHPAEVAPRITACRTFLTAREQPASKTLQTPINSPKVPEALRMGFTATRRLPSVMGAPNHVSSADAIIRIHTTTIKIGIDLLIVFACTTRRRTKKVK
jgi:hypothetical protein